MIAEVQCIPSPAGTPQDAYQHVDAAIAAIADSGLPYEVGALGTTLEGAPDAVWDAIRAAHEASASPNPTRIPAARMVPRAAMLAPSR